MDLDLRTYLRVLRKRKWFAAVGLLVAIGLGVLFTAQTSPQYRARATLFVGERQVLVEEAHEGLFVRAITVGLLKSYAEIIKSRHIAQRAIVDGGLDVTPGEIEGGVEARALLDTQIIEITYEGTDPVRTQRVTNSVADAFVSEIEQLGLQAGDGTPAVQVSLIDRAVTPGSPFAPNPVRNVTLAAALGLLLGLGLVMLVEQLDVSVKDREEIESYGIPVIGSVPRLQTAGQEVFLDRDTQGVGVEAFRKLRTSIGFLDLEKPIASIIVTSPVAREGKTTTALNLAAAYAMGGLRTILVEADLRRPSLHRIFGTYGMRGLTTAIVGEVPLAEAVVHTDIRNLSVLLAGAIPPNPVELLGSDQMADLLGELERTADVVVLDTPPLVPVADTASMAARAGGVVLVARSGSTDRRRLQDAAKVVERAGGRMLGIVLNDVKVAKSPYDYDYYYGYRGVGDPARVGEESP